MRIAPKGLLLFAVIAALAFPVLADQPGTPPDEAVKAPATADQTPPPAPAPKPAPAPAGAQIKVNDNVNIKFGVLLQPQADFTDNSTSTGSIENFWIRRTRFIAAGQVAKNVFFFFQTENNRLGGAVGGNTKSTAGFQTTDAVAEFRYSKALNLWAGLIYLPTSREALKSSATEFMIDVNSYAYTATTALAGTGGRDTGFMLRGYALNDHLEYRAGFFQGLRTNTKAPFRQIARVQYDFFDTEVYNLPSYAGSFFGTKKIVAVGAAWDKQGTYKGPTADLFIDWPTAYGSINNNNTIMRLDGGNDVPALGGKSNIFVSDVGFYFKGPKIGPWLRYEQRTFTAPNSSKNEKRYVVGVNWYPYLSNFNIKFGYGKLRPVTGVEQNQYTLQMQFFYF